MIRVDAAWFAVEPLDMRAGVDTALKIDQLTHEIATLNRWRYAKRSEQIDAVQRSLLDESIDADIEAISLEIEALHVLFHRCSVHGRKRDLP